jgi:hypothetical protein
MEVGVMTDKRKAIEEKIHELAQLIGEAVIIDNDIDCLTYNQIYANMYDKQDGSIVVLRVTTRPFKSLEHYRRLSESMRPAVIEE